MQQVSCKDCGQVFLLKTKVDGGFEVYFNPPEGAPEPLLVENCTVCGEAFNSLDVFITDDTDTDPDES